MSKKEKYRYYISMNKEQYDEMYNFYIKLGYSEKQAKKLSSSCFGAEIKVNEDAFYKSDWTFWRTLDAPDEPRGLRGAIGAMFGGARSKSAPPVGAVYEEMADASAPVHMKCAPMPMMNMSAAMPMMGGAMPGGMSVGMPMPQEQFNSAETHNANEIEEESTLDRPQMIFSANVNTASWSYIRDKVSRHERIDKSFVRIEEILNSYPYKMKAPKNDDLFSIKTEHGKCPWNEENELLMVGLKGRKAPKKVKQNLAFLVDVSGSMENEWVLVQMSLAAIMSKLNKGDYMSVIAYSDNTVTVVEKMKCGDMGDYVKAILAIDGIGGCTRGSEGLENAYKYLTDNYDKEANNRVFIFTDGDFNFGITSEGGLSDFIYKKRETGIYLSIVGFGRNNFKDNKMESLARNGNGNYTFVTNPADIIDNLWEKLVSSLVTVAKDVKISVELNPYYAKKYRLIGYDARVLTQKEFNDTEKATDGIGSEHNVVALIEFKKGTAEKTYSNRYVTTKTEDNKDEFAFIEIHYKTPDGVDSVITHTVGVDVLDKADGKNMPVITLLAAFGLLIKDSEYKGSADKKMISELLSAAEENEKESAKDKFGHLSIIRKYIG